MIVNGILAAILWFCPAVYSQPPALLGSDLSEEESSEAAAVIVSEDDAEDGEVVKDTDVSERTGKKAFVVKKGSGSVPRGGDALKGDATSEKPLDIPAQSGAGFKVTRKHKVVKGDTLWDLSSNYYGDPYKWGKIYNANTGTVENPDLIYPSNELAIPDITEEVSPKTTSAVGSSVSPVKPLPEPEAKAAAAPVRQAKPSSKDKENYLYEQDKLSEEMPEDQKEWTAVKIVPDNWKEDGRIVSKIASSKGYDETFSISGESVRLVMEEEGRVSPGDRLSAYLKGTASYGKDGKYRGKEIQYAGTLEIISVDGKKAEAVVSEAATSIAEGMIVKKDR